MQGIQDDKPLSPAAPRRKYADFERDFVLHAAVEWPKRKLDKQQASEYVKSRSQDEIHASCWGSKADSFSSSAGQNYVIHVAKCQCFQFPSAKK